MPARGVLVPPRLRNLGMVFQSYAVWPHMTVRHHAGVHSAGPAAGRHRVVQAVWQRLPRRRFARDRLACGSLGGAERIVVSQLEDAGTVKVFSSGSALDDGPALYLQSPNAHGHAPTFREIASFNPFDGTSGTRVAMTSTTDGADLLVSGVRGRSASVVRYEFARPNAQATVLQARRFRIRRK